MELGLVLLSCQEVQTQHGMKVFRIFPKFRIETEFPLNESQLRIDVINGLSLFSVYLLKTKNQLSLIILKFRILTLTFHRKSI